MVISDKSRFIKTDSDGAIYLLPINKFQFDKDKGLGRYECVNKEKIIPYTKLEFSSALEAMKKFGVKICFATKEQFKFYITLSGKEQSEFLTNSEIDCN